MSDQKTMKAKAQVASDPFTALLNAIIKKMLPKINSGISGAIKGAHLDPWGQVAHGSDTLGSINLGICHASAGASYAIQNMTGLSGFQILDLTVTSTHTDSQDPNKLYGTVVLKAGIGNNLSTHVGGSVEAKCGFLHPHVGIGGTATVSGVTAAAAGSFTAALNSKGDVCLTGVKLSNTSIDYGHVNVSIDGLGIFNSLLSPLVDAIVGLFKGPIRGAISAAVSPVINAQIAKVLPQCTSL